MRLDRRFAAALLVPAMLTAWQAAPVSAVAQSAVQARSAQVQPIQARAVQARGPLVAAANPLAAEAGMAVLRRGGSAVDAAVAVQAVLGLVEPQSSGLGGGAFLMAYLIVTVRAGNAPSLLALLGQMLPTLLAFPAAAWLIERFDDTDVRFR